MALGFAPLFLPKKGGGIMTDYELITITIMIITLVATLLSVNTKR